MFHRQEMIDYVQQLQQTICQTLQTIDDSGAIFRQDNWQRPQNGGGGQSCVLENSRLFEKAGVNVSVVNGELSSEAMQAMTSKKLAMTTQPNLAKHHQEARDFFATGISLVLHPHHPMAPTVHANYRYFERAEGALWWFGGGADLTPSYLFEEDAKHFHRQHQKALQAHDATLYPRFKQGCDDYFYLPHRQETRGIGGIFFDDWCDRSANEIFSIVKSCGDAFLPAYLPILQKRSQMPYEAHQKQWQRIRRGRYVEFNLLYDRGTLFGLRTGGRIESILMSLPQVAHWPYDYHPESQSPEAKLLEVLHKPRNWLTE